MKHMIRVVLAAAIVLAGLTLVTPQAGASTVTVLNNVPSGYQSATHLGQPLAPTGGANPDVSISCCGLGTFLVTLNHDDLHRIIVTAFADGLTAEFSYICALIPSWVTAPICLAAVWADRGIFNYYIDQAWNNTTWVADLQCSFTTWYCPGGTHTFWGWIRPVQISGLNVLFSWVMVPIGYQVNPYA